MWTLLLKNKLKYPASMSNNGILNVAEYRYFVAPIVVASGRPIERSPNADVIISASKKKKNQAALQQKLPAISYNANKFILNLIFPECS